VTLGDRWCGKKQKKTRKKENKKRTSLALSPGENNAKK
jgi:hypothetical protein